jgi:hypothetical protein
LRVLEEAARLLPADVKEPELGHGGYQQDLLKYCAEGPLGVRCI